MGTGQNPKSYMHGYTKIGPKTAIFTFVQKVFSWCNFTIQKGPWFSGRAGLVISPWVPGFNTNTMVVTKMTVWVRLHNVPLPFCHHQVLENIGNSIGRFIMLDRERMDIGIFTFARLCKEMDLRKGLPDLHIFNSQRTQVGINTWFRKHSVHMQSMSPNWTFKKHLYFNPEKGTQEKSTEERVEISGFVTVRWRDRGKWS